MKDHEIAISVNNITRDLHEWYILPQSLREVISNSVLKSLNDQGLRKVGTELA